MADWSTEAEGAIRAYEEATGLVVTIHDHSHCWWQLLPTGRFQHMHPACAAAKAMRQPHCTAFDVDRIGTEAASRPQGMLKLCHAGILEAVVPRIEDGRVRWLLFAGALRPVGTPIAFIDPNPLPHGGPWTEALRHVPAGDARGGAMVLELLRQLAARLAAIADQATAAQLPASGVQTRADAVRRFVHDHHPEAIGLGDLATALGLSRSRAGHAVREATGSGFLELLAEARLRSAAGLLRHTGLGVPEIARRAGFANLSNFHRRFRQRFGGTPRQYRVRAEG